MATNFALTTEARPRTTLTVSIERPQFPNAHPQFICDSPAVRSTSRPTSLLQTCHITRPCRCAKVRHCPHGLEHSIGRAEPRLTSPPDHDEAIPFHISPTNRCPPPRPLPPQASGAAPHSLTLLHVLTRHIHATDPATPSCCPRHFQDHSRNILLSTRRHYVHSAPNHSTGACDYHGALLPRSCAYGARNTVTISSCITPS